MSSDRDRLIELFSPFADGTYNGSGTIIDGTKVDDVVNNLLANGVIVPPCKNGDKVYTYGAKRVKEWEITFCGKNSRGEYLFRAADEGFKNLLEFWHYEIKQTVFLTKEEAEEKLKDLGKNGN